MELNRRAFLGAAGALAAASWAPRARAVETRKYKACIIGDTAGGGYGHSMHLAFALQPAVSVVALADPDEAGRARMAAECGAAATYADYEEMLAKEKPDLVAVGPRHTVRHKEYLLACVAAGAHGFMEKPLCVDLAEADAMVAAAAAKNLKWQLAYNFRVSPYMAAVKERITTDGLLGSILEVRARGKEDHRAGAEDLIVLGTHLFDLMIYFLGDPQWCMADITHNGLPATPADIREATEPLGPVLGNRIHALYGFEKGIAGHFSSMKSRDGDGGRWGLRICGTRGVVDIANDVVPVVRWLEDPSWRGTTEGRTWKPLPNLPEFTVTDEQRERHQFLAADLLAAIEEDRAPQADLAIARKAQEMIQAAFAAYTTGGRVSLPLAQREHPLRTWKT